MSQLAGVQVSEQIELLNDLEKRVAACTACALHTGRTLSVFSDGNPFADVMIIGEGPGQKEDETGLPFVGRSGQLLTKLIESVGFSRQNDVYICNIVKCRPPHNRAPLKSEMATCEGYLHQQIRWVQPQLILLAGATAAKGVLGLNQPISQIRGQWFTHEMAPNALLMPLFHPSYLLRNPTLKPGSPKALMMQDLEMVWDAYKRLPQMPKAQSAMS